MTVGIILPVRNGGEFIKHTLKALVNSTKYPCKIIIVESESTDDTAKTVDTWAEQFENIIVYHIANDGFISALNYGIQKAIDLDLEGVYLTQDDVIHFPLFGRDWLKIMVDIGKADNCGMVISLNAGGVSGKDYVEGLPWAGTWSTYIPMKTIRKVGTFDENFNPGFGDDIDYSYRVHKRGLLIYVANFWVDHHRMGEHLNAGNKDEEVIKKEHALYFRKKFGIGELI